MWGHLTFVELTCSGIPSAHLGLHISRSTTALELDLTVSTEVLFALVPSLFSGVISHKTFN